jgi:hypothetical protein
VYVIRTALVWKQEYPMLTQGGKEGLDVDVRVELDGKDIRAMRKSLDPDALTRVEAVDQGSAFGHGSAEPLCEALHTLQGKRCGKTR